MATFSLGSGITPGAPGVYINEQAGRAANAELASFSTVYMLVETEENVPVTRFPFNQPIPITSLLDYRALLGGIIPEERIPLLSYNCVNEFFQNAQVGDLRVVRVGTPNQIVELEFFPSGSKTNATDLPSALMAGDKVFVQMIINGLRLVAGDGSTGYTANGEWLGVPVEIPVDYVAGDEVNNRRISRAIADAVAEAIESNPSVRASVYVRDFGLITDLDPLSNSQNGFVSIAATTFDGNVSVVTEVFPVGSNYVFMQNTYDVENIVGQQGNLERVPQDYTQCISTAFDGQQDQGYLITPTAYAQFDAKGRALIGAAAAAHCESNNFKWMALADPGPYLVTDVNKYQNFVPHQPASDLVTGLRYLVDNAIYEWTGVDVSYPKLTYQEIVKGSSAAIPIAESANPVAQGAQVGLLDSGIYSLSSNLGQADEGKFIVGTTNYWPVDLQIQEVVLGDANSLTNDFQNARVTGSATPVQLDGTTVYIVAPPFDTATTASYSLQTVYIALNPAAATALLDEVVAAGGTSYMTAVPATNDVVYVQFPTGSTATVSYGDPYWNLPTTINGQTSNLIQNISNQTAGVNTNHLPATLQDPTNTYRLSFTSRTIFNPANATGGLSNYGGTVAEFAGSIQFNAANHGLVNGQKLYFTQPITNGSTTIVKATTKLVTNPYFVKVVDVNNFVLASSLTAYTGKAYLQWPSGVVTLSTKPTIFYTNVLGGGQTATTLSELTTVPFVRARKYDFATGSVYNQAASTASAPNPTVGNPGVSIWLNNSSLVLGEELISPWGEDKTSLSLCGWLPKLNLASAGLPVTTVDNAYCVPTVDQNYAAEAYMVPSIDPIFGGVYDPTGLATTGPIATLGAFAGGVGSTVGVYTNVAATGGTGIGATLNVTIGTTATVGPISTLGAFTPGSGTVNTNAGSFTTSFTGVVSSISGGTAGAGATLDVNVANTATVGPVVDFLTFNTTTPDAGGPTTYLNVATTPVTGTGTGLTVDVTVDAGGLVTAVVVNAVGSGYATGNTVSFNLPGGGVGDATVDNVTLPIAVSAVTLNAPGTGYDTTSVLTVASASIANVTGFSVPVSAVILPTGVTAVVLNNAGTGFTAGDSLTVNGALIGGGTNVTVAVASITGATTGALSSASQYAIAAGLANGSSGADIQSLLTSLTGVYFDVSQPGTAPDNTTLVVAGDRIAVIYDGAVAEWVVVPAATLGGDLTSVGQVCYQSQVEMVFTPEQTPPTNLWRFDAITSTEIIDNALRGVGFNGVPQAVFIEAGIDNVNRLYDDSQRYFNPFGFIAYYGPYIENGAGQFIPPSPYVTGVAVRRYRAEGYQFPPAGVKYQLADAIATQIPINSAQQNLLNPDGCNAVRTLPGYPQTAVFIWGGRTRVNTKDAQQRLYQFVNTRVILNVVYGSLRTAFDNQIFNVIDGFGVIYNQIISVGNSILNQLYVRGALFGSRPSDAFQVICDERINPPESLENGIVNAKVFVTPVPTLERIQIDLIRVAIGKMQEELDIQGLGTNNSGSNF